MMMFSDMITRHGHKLSSLSLFIYRSIPLIKICFKISSHIDSRLNLYFAVLPQTTVVELLQ
jgi:hypothetical protein